ncbi:MAG: hypothetical protein ABI416_17795 [Ginsengibacter sp.]
MDVKNESLQELRHIKIMMERSTKFSSLSGLSGIGAGICALMGAWFGSRAILAWQQGNTGDLDLYASRGDLANRLLLIALSTFAASFIVAFIFIYLRCKKLHIGVLGFSARRVMVNVAIPLAVGGLFIFRLTTLGTYELISPACLIFYGLALINASRYTLIEVRYLGFTELIIGIINLWFLKYGLFFWGLGFGLIHIVYGMIFWMIYERDGATKMVTSTNE